MCWTDSRIGVILSQFHYLFICNMQRHGMPLDRCDGVTLTSNPWLLYLPPFAMASRRSVWGSFEEYSNATRCPFHRCDRVTLTSIQPIFASTESFPMASQLCIWGSFQKCDEVHKKGNFGAKFYWSRVFMQVSTACILQWSLKIEVM